MLNTDFDPTIELDRLCELITLSRKKGVTYRYTDEVKNKVKQLKNNGVSIPLICARSGINMKSIYHWTKKKKNQNLKHHLKLSMFLNLQALKLNYPMALSLKVFLFQMLRSCSVMHYPNKKLKIFVYQEPIDMRYSFNKLTAYITDDYSMDILLEGHAFVFFGRNRYRLKVLIYDGSGLVLLIKRIEVGKFMWVHDLDKEEISHKEFEQLVHGSILRKGRLGEMP